MLMVISLERINKIKMDKNPKQQIVEKIKKSTNILVTVSDNPDVDALAAACVQRR